MFGFFRRTEALDQLLSWADRYDVNATDLTTGRNDDLAGTILTRATEEDVLVLPKAPRPRSSA